MVIYYVNIVGIILAGIDGNDIGITNLMWVDRGRIMMIIINFMRWYRGFFIGKQHHVEDSTD